MRYCPPQPEKRTRFDLSATIRWCVLLMGLSAPIFAQDNLQSAPRDDSWDNLKHITHRRSYLVVDRQLNCVYGRISAVTDRSLKLKADSTSARVTLERSKILRILESPTGGGTIYSGKSSWSEIRALSPEAEVKIVTNQGDQHTGKLIAAICKGRARPRVCGSKQAMERWGGICVS